MKTMLTMLLKNMSKDVYTIIYSVLLPVGLLIGLFVFFEDPVYREQLLAGVLSLNIMMGALNLMAFDVLQPRNRGVLKLVRATPLTVFSFVAVFASARIAFTFAINAVVLAVGVFGFGVELSLLECVTTLGVLLLGALPLIGLGFLCGNLAQQEGQVNMLTSLLCFSMIFTSESFYSMQNAPAWAQRVGEFLPYSPFVDAVRAAMNGSFDTIPPLLLTLVLFACAAMLLAVVTFRWEPAHK